MNTQISPRSRRLALLRLLTLASMTIACGVDAGAEVLDSHVILISCDGMRPDAVELLGEEGLPNLFRLMKEGASTKNARTDKTHTVTLPNHTSMITGRPVSGEAGHGWKENSTPKLGQMLHRNKRAYLRSMFGVAHDHGLRTALFSSKTKFVLYDRSYDGRSGKVDEVGDDDGRDKIDEFVFVEDIADLMARYVVAMSERPFQLSMLHLRDTDSAGHKYGWDLTEGSPYMQAAVRIDVVIGDLLALIDADERLKGKTSIILTADHGGRMETKTHIKATERFNYTIPFVVWGPGVDAGAELYEINSPNRKDPGSENPAYDADGPPPIRNGDAGNLALTLLALPAIEGSSINANQDLKVRAARELEVPG